MRLSDTAIRERLESGSLVIQPGPRDRAIQPASVDLHLSRELRTFDATTTPISPTRRCATSEVYISDWYVLEPGGFVLGSTLEHISLPSDLVAIVEGKSTLGRIGLAVHITAGFIDPGFEGNITLELKNMNQVPIKLIPSMPVCQLGFEPVQGPVARAYGTEGLGSKYQHSQGTVAPRPTLRSGARSDAPTTCDAGRGCWDQRTGAISGRADVVSQPEISRSKC